MADTIAAIATPLGEGGVGIVRVSGPNSLSIMKSIYRECPDEVIPRHVYYGHAVDNHGTVLDDMVSIYMKAPHTFTGDDIVEFQAHGSNVSLKLILRSVIASGARLADPGEFTKIAFLNGRLDLSQAEAVIDLIKARSEKPLSIASDQLNGSLGQEIVDIRNHIKDVLAQMTVNIDFPDEDIEQVSYDEFLAELMKQQERLGKLIKSAEFGKLAREGIKLALVGRTNVGKSSLMNGLLRQSRAIVTDIPGTTRDTIEENINIKGVPILLTDTAGIRETEDAIEAIGIQRSKDSFNKSDLVIMVMDGNREIEDEDKEILKLLEPSKSTILLNKIDLESNITIEDIEAIKDDVRILPVTMKDFSYIEKIEEEILNMVYSGSISQKDSIIITNVRQKNLLEKTEKSLYDAIEISRLYEPLEIIEIDVNSAYISLGEILGEEAGDDILNEVFSRFCLGK